MTHRVSLPTSVENRDEIYPLVKHLPKDLEGSDVALVARGVKSFSQPALNDLVSKLLVKRLAGNLIVAGASPELLEALRSAEEYHGFRDRIRSL